MRQRMPSNTTWAVITAALLASALGAASSADAATFTVNTTADTPDASAGNGVCSDSGGNCSLRAAVMETNALAGTDTINLPAGTFTLNTPGANEESAATGDLDILGAVTIQGAVDG